MKALRFITIIALFFFALGASAKKKREYPRAKIKGGYNYYNKFLRGGDGVVEKNTPFILLANQEQSKFYCPSTEYRDSLLSTPSGRAKERQMFDAAAAAYVQNRDRSAMDGVVYHSRLYVTKDFAKSVSTTYDQAGMGECGYYDEPFSEIDWLIVEDSTKTILDYQCIMATTDFHGRKWTVWFTPEIPMQDGPWKFCGLPGLIMEASEPSVQHCFTVTGIETSSQPIFPVFNTEYEKMNRIDMLKAYAAYRKGSAAYSRAMIMDTPDGSKVEMDAPLPPKSNTQNIDFPETDYH